MADLTPLLDLYRGIGASGAYDEAVTQLAHALQTAALADAAGAPDALVVAALLHDVGHLLEEDEFRASVDHRHEASGARALRTWFGPDVTAPVALHVAAKRYLCATEPAYLATLSEGSVHSLGLQGGPMSDDEVDAFETLDRWEDAVRLRRWDDEAKVVDLEVPALDAYVERMTRLSSRSSPAA